jgi:hypothetical protein
MTGSTQSCLSSSDMNKGNITLNTAIIGALGMVMASAFTAWASSSAAVSDLRVQQAATAQKSIDIDARLNRIELKLDQVISKGTLSKAQ